MEIFQAYLIICGPVGLVLIGAVLLVWYLERRRRQRLAKWIARWQSMGFVPHSGPRRGFTREHRGRSLSMSHAGISYGDSELLATSVRVALGSCLGGFLTITPKWYQIGLERLAYRIAGPKTHEIEDHFSIHSNPPDLATRLLVHPRISQILFSDPKPTIELKRGELQFKRPGDFPGPEDALALFDTVCDLAELIEQASGSSSAG